MIPDRVLCLQVLEEEGVPGHIRVHSELVASVAMKIASALNVRGESLDLPLLEAGALLHDIMKMKAIENGGDHAILGGERVAELGYGELAPLVSRHVNIGGWEPDGPVTEAELVNYADKRVRHTEIVTLSERFDDLMSRYGRSKGAMASIGRHRQTLAAIEEKIFRIIGIAPESFGLD